MKLNSRIACYVRFLPKVRLQIYFALVRILRFQAVSYKSTVYVKRFCFDLS